MCDHAYSPVINQGKQEYTGHLLVCFMAEAIKQSIQHELNRRRSIKASFKDVDYVLNYLRNQKCKVYSEYTVPEELGEDLKDLFGKFGIKVPERIPHTV